MPAQPPFDPRDASWLTLASLFPVCPEGKDRANACANLEAAIAVALV
jgi:hypothetical protein